MYIVVTSVDCANAPQKATSLPEVIESQEMFLQYLRLFGFKRDCLVIALLRQNRAADTLYTNKPDSTFWLLGIR